LLVISVPARAPVAAAALYGLYGAALLVGNVRWDRPLLTSSGTALVVGMTLWLVWQFAGTQQAVWGAALGAEALTAGTLAIGLRRYGIKTGSFAEPLARSAEAIAGLSTAAVAGTLVLAPRWALGDVIAAGCLTICCGGLAWNEQRRGLMRIAGACGLAGALLAAGLAGSIWPSCSGLAYLALASGAYGLVLAVAAQLTSGTFRRSWQLVAILASAVTVGLSAVAALELTTWVVSQGLWLAAATLLCVSWRAPHRLIGVASSLLIAVANLTSFCLIVPAESLWTTTLLAQASMMLGVWTITRKGDEEETRSAMAAPPLGSTALLCSYISAALTAALILPSGQHGLAAAGAWFWLGLLCSFFAQISKSARSWAAYQLALVLAVVNLAGYFAMGWGVSASNLGIINSAQLQAWGIGLAALSIGWGSARALARQDSGASIYLEPPWPAVDRVVLAVLVVGIAIRAACTISMTALAWGTGSIVRFNADPGQLWFLGLTALALVTFLWDRFAVFAVYGLIIIAGATAISLGSLGISGAGSALIISWYLAGVAVLITLLGWRRQSLTRLAGETGWNTQGLRRDTVRWLGLLLTGLPVIVLAGVAVASTALGEVQSNVMARAAWPLLVVGIALAFQAMDQSAPGFLAGGLTAIMAAAVTIYTGRFLSLHAAINGTAGQELGVHVLQIIGLSAAVGTIAWLWWLEQRREPASSNEWKLILSVAAVGPVAAIVIVGGATILLVGAFPGVDRWVRESGSQPTWWLVLLNGVGYRMLVQKRTELIYPRGLAGAGLFVLALAACTIERWFGAQGWGFRALILLWAAPAGLSVLYPAYQRALVSLSGRWLDALTLGGRIGVSLSVVLGMRAAFQIGF
jgi:hypothetical protein